MLTVTWLICLLRIPRVACGRRQSRLHAALPRPLTSARHNFGTATTNYSNQNGDNSGLIVAYNTGLADSSADEFAAATADAVTTRPAR